MQGTKLQTWYEKLVKREKKVKFFTFLERKFLPEKIGRFPVGCCRDPNFTKMLFRTSEAVANTGGTNKRGKRLNIIIHYRLFCQVVK